MSDIDSWLERRRSYVGASDSAGILGVSPWASPLSVWADKIGLFTSDPVLEHLQWGKILEPVILREYGRRNNVRVAHNSNDIVAHSDQSTHMACTPDGYELDSEGAPYSLIEVKTTSMPRWDDLPVYYQIQVQHQMACTGIDTSKVIVLHCGHTMTCYDVMRDDAFIGILERACAAFWEFVSSCTPPASIGTTMCRDTISAMHPSDNGKSVLLPGVAMQWDEDLAAVKKEIKRLSGVKDNLESKIKAAIGDATYGVLPDGRRYKWANHVRKGHVVKESTVRVLRALKVQ